MSGPDRLVVVRLPSLAVDAKTVVPDLPRLPRAEDRQVEGTSRLLGYRLVTPMVSVRSNL